MFQPNVGGLDKIGRIVLGLALLAAFFLSAGPYHWLFLIGVVPLATGIFNFCPLYTLLGINTCPMQK